MSDLATEMLEILDAPSPELSEAAPNRQLYPNSKLAGSPVEAQLLSSSDALFNTKLPNLAIIHEKPEHRIIVYLKAQGRTNREIAKKMEYTEAWVSQITRQPWFQLKLLKEVEEAGGESVERFLSAQLEPSILQLVHLRDHAKSEAVQLGATVNLLDRFLGKPVQRVEQKLEVTKREDKIRSIDDEIKQLEEAEVRIKKQLGGGGGGAAVTPNVASTTVASPA